MKAKKIHFTGIGGIGMSALAALMLKEGHLISGSDQGNSEVVEHLMTLGVKIYLQQQASNLDQDTDLLVYSLAVPEENEELKQAKNLGIETLTYPQALGKFMQGFEQSISICGTHGKSTSTAMMANVFKKAGLDPTVLLGTKLAELSGHNYRYGKKDFFILESCEYKEGFLAFHPTAVLLTNLDPDHLDYYQNEENYLKAFQKFIDLLPENGVLVANGDDPNIKRLVMSGQRLVTFGKNEDNDYVLHGKNIFYMGNKMAELNLQVPGEHNRVNALGVLVMASQFGIEPQIILEALNHFGGTWRRLELKGCLSSGALFYDDYAHHPVEIKATLQAMRELYPSQNLIAVFQPHQHSRTKFLLEEFAKSFDLADQVIVPNIYKVRDSEEDVKAVSTDDLVVAISQYHKNVMNGQGFEKTAQFLKDNTTKDDIVLIMGAGDIEELSTILKG